MPHTLIFLSEKREQEEQYKRKVFSKGSLRVQRRGTLRPPPPSSFCFLQLKAKRKVLDFRAQRPRIAREQKERLRPGDNTQRRRRRRRRKMKKEEEEGLAALLSVPSFFPSIQFIFLPFLPSLPTPRRSFSGNKSNLAPLQWQLLASGWRGVWRWRRRRTRRPPSNFVRYLASSRFSLSNPYRCIPLGCPLTFIVSSPRSRWWYRRKGRRVCLSLRREWKKRFCLLSCNVAVSLRQDCFLFVAQGPCCS